jgi:phosphatidylserine/phosphatidylglycerophosphate/cardiolipin synthase-like enzyme
MPETRFISDDKILPAIYELIEQAAENLVIVSPYVSLWGHLSSKLDKAKVQPLIIARKNQEGKLDDLIEKMNAHRIELRLVENLHAKIYLNEKKCIISSMNLYEFSTSNSKEIAVIIEDEETLKEINKYIDEELLSQSEIVTITASKMIAKGLKNIAGFVSNLAQKDTVNIALPEKKSPKNDLGKKGFCIRCHKEIKNNPDKPLCPDCYEKWAIYSKPTYKEKYCHVCGKQEQTSLEKPVCINCYRKLR